MTAGRPLLIGLFLVAFCACQPGAPQDPLTRLDTPAAGGSALPHLSRAQPGTVVLSWVEPVADGDALRYSVMANGRWQAPQTVTTGADWFVNWADFPSVTPIADDLWAAHWLTRRPGGTYSYDVSIAVSTNAGRSWSSPVTPHTDGTRTEHGFVTLFPWQQGVGAVWLDGREMSGDDDDPDSGGPMTLRAAALDGAGRLIAEALIDDQVCDCCQTDAAIAAAGPLVVYRDRTADEIRDIHIAAATGSQWRAGGAVHDDHWTIPGCPVNGPAIAADGDAVAIAWFTAADGKRVRLARSADGGQHFSPPVEIDSASTVGRVDVEMLDDGDVAVSWLAETENGGEIRVRRVDAGGRPGPVRIVARTPASRASGFPQMIRDGNDLLFAWTDAGGDQSRVLSARFAIAGLTE